MDAMHTGDEASPPGEASDTPPPCDTDPHPESAEPAIISATQETADLAVLAASTPTHTATSPDLPAAGLIRQRQRRIGQLVRLRLVIPSSQARSIPRAQTLLTLLAALAVLVVATDGLIHGLGFALALGPAAPVTRARAKATDQPTPSPTEIEATATALPPTPPPTIPSGPVVSLPGAANLVDLWHRPDLLDRGCLQAAPSAAASVVVGGQYARAPNEVALTFDDGPTPNSSPMILDVLERTHTPATFFVLGRYVSAFPYLVQREWNDGFSIGIHTWDHPDMTTLSAGAVQAQFADTISALRGTIGNTGCNWFWRPPYGSYNAFVISQAQSFGLTTVKWDTDPADWSRPGVQTIAARVLAFVHPGAIVLMHDGPALREQTAAALPIILQGLKDRGLQPVTLPRLLADAGYPGAISVPPTPTPTPIPPTPTPTPIPTDTPVPPTPIPVPTATPVPPTPAPTP